MTILGVDLGGTKTAAAIVEPDGSVRYLAQIATPGADGAEAVLDAVAGLVRHVATTSGGEPVAVGVASAGTIDPASGVVLAATDAIASWAGTAVASGLSARLGVPVAVENDVAAHARGEALYGAARGQSCALVIAVGTGVGGAVLLDGEPLRGARGAAGAIGHLPTPGAEGMRCGCGGTGHLEAIASGPALYRLYLALGGDHSVIGSRAVVERAMRGEALAASAVRMSARALGVAVAGLVAVVDPGIVVIGGGLAEAGELWWQELESAARAGLVAPARDIRIVPAALGATAAIVGAAHRVSGLVASPTAVA